MTVELSKFKSSIDGDKKEAERDLSAALPYLRNAEAAVDSLKKKDVDELASMAKPSDITKLTMDAVQILL